jgi:hypothetical protein
MNAERLRMFRQPIGAGEVCALCALSALMDVSTAFRLVT